MVSTSIPTLAVGVCDFGWGSYGKLRLILDCLPEVAPVLVAESDLALTVNRLLDLPSPIAASRAPLADAALVINDPTMADRFVSEGMKVVYVDSLPYLWTIPSEVPGPVTTYCAQRIPGGQPVSDGPLAEREGLIWIDPIVPVRGSSDARSGVIVSVGGLHSHLSGQSERAYLELVLVPLVEALAQCAKCYRCMWQPADLGGGPCPRPNLSLGGRGRPSSSSKIRRSSRKRRVSYFIAGKYDVAPSRRVRHSHGDSAAAESESNPQRKPIWAVGCKEPTLAPRGLGLPAGR